MSTQVQLLESSKEPVRLLGTAEFPDAVEGTQLTKRQCCKLKYRFRFFSSKGASLVLIWTLLVSIAFGSLDNLFLGFLNVFNEKSYLTYVTWLPYIPWFVCALLSGWLADAQFGNYRMVRSGVVLLFVTAFLQSILQLTRVSLSGDQPLYYFVLSTILTCFGYASRAMILVTSLQLGLNQIPDASAANVTSFIAWFVACLYAGNWINSFTNRVAYDCLSSSLDQNLSYSQLVWLFTVFCLSIVLCSDFFLSPKWLSKELKLPQSSKTISQVLKFAAKHKAPVNRSALTYWEDDIPSRIDLGKSKYGGPFTTEQVEDVKTILRMLSVSVPLFLIFISFYLYQQFIYVKDYEATILSNDSCPNVLLRSFTYSTSWWVVGGISIYEFAIYPFIVPIIPTILKRIGCTSLLIFLVNATALIVSVIDFSKEISDPADTDWFWIVHSLLSAPLKILLLTCVFEFVCAQSPHNMKGLMIGYAWSEYYLSNIFANILAGTLHALCKGPVCSIIYSSVATFLSITGFIVYCILAIVYKRRVRDDISTPHRWAEEFYGRYLPDDKP